MKKKILISIGCVIGILLIMIVASGFNVEKSAGAFL